MIPRTLVPKGARPPAADVATTRRRASTLDERTLVPSTLPIVPLDGHSSIPTNLPLEAIATRVVVPRDINVEAVQRPDESTLPVQPTEMDERITIPHGVAPPEELPEHLPVSEDLVQPDIIQTGELSFLPTVRLQKASTGEMIVVSCSLMLNLLFILAIAYVVSYRARSNEQEEIGRRQISVLLPPGALESLKPSTPRAPRPPVKVDPRDIRRVAPTIEPPVMAPAPQPEPPKKELPSAPVPKPSTVAPTQQPPAQGARGDLPKQPVKLETPSMPVPQSGLILPKRESPGDAIRDAARAAGKMSSPAPVGGGGPLPGGGQGGGGGGHGTAGAGVEMLTDTQGVDFNDYLRRVYITVKQNWFSVMPASVQLGDQGVVSLQFKIMRDGSVPDGDPQRVFGSGKEPLDRAAVSSIRASNPFPQLPNAFKGPYIELRFTYYYNMPIPTR
jgi:outer membrane biosynthesis protein TonB